MIGEALLAHLTSIGELSAGDADAVRLVKGEVRTIHRCKDILRPGDASLFVVIVLKGLLCSYATSAKGTRQIHNFYIPTDAPSLVCFPPIADIRRSAISVRLSAAIGGLIPTL
jgi:hypothetical protein